ncbi:WD-40 repeat-containing protein MSI4 [Bienertia sinuspersici]
MPEKGKGGRSGKSGELTVDEKYSQWKSLVPILYDWLANHNLVWPSLSCRWGPVLEQATYKSRQRLYLVPNTLVIANVEVVKPRVAAAEHISQFNEEARSPFVKKFKTIIHPGEVNRIRELPQNSNIVATHTDSPDILTGHQENAEFALAMCSCEPLVLSGGKDKLVVLWSIHDHVSTLATEPGSGKPVSAGSNIKSAAKTGDGNNGNADSPSLGARGIYKGHDDTVEDVQFCPTSAQQFCSVGDDSCLILWDTRIGLDPVMKVEKAHDADLHCVDWNPHDENLILTGSADNSIHMFDRRNLTTSGVGSPVHKFQGHSDPVLCVQWSPHNRSVFGSAAEDGLLNIWDYERVGKMQAESGTKLSEYPAGLFFKHAGHRDKVVDFHWNSTDPWTFVSVSDDCSSSAGGGTLQMWRIIDLLYRPEDEVLAELDKFRSHVTTCPPV